MRRRNLGDMLLAANLIDRVQMKVALSEQKRTGKRFGSTLIDQGKPAAVSSGESKGFITDVLRDSSGSISLHRFQMFVWTLVLGVIFISSVYKSLSMPQFSATLLGLMGISSGTYLGFQVPETKATDAGPTPPPT